MRCQVQPAAGRQAETKCLHAGVQLATVESLNLPLEANNSRLREPHNYSFEITSLQLCTNIIHTFNDETHSERHRAVALMYTGVIPLVSQAEGGKLQEGFPILCGELPTVLLPGQLEQRGALGLRKLQRTAELKGQSLLSHKDHLLLHPALIHTGLSYK